MVACEAVVVVAGDNRILRWDTRYPSFLIFSQHEVSELNVLNKLAGNWSKVLAAYDINLHCEVTGEFSWLFVFKPSPSEPVPIIKA